MERGTRRTWAAHVQRWRASGLTAREFAHRVGVNPATLRWWSSRLRRVPAHGGTDSAVPPLTFVEMTHATRSEPIEVVLVSGVRVRVPSDFDAAHVARLLDVLAARP
jgi:transposase